MIQNSPILPGMIDSHFHNMEMIKKGIDTKKIIKQCFNSGMEALIDISTSISNYDTRLQFAMENKNIFITCGISPGKAENQTEELDKMLKILAAQINDAKKTNKLIAIGETGLDWYWNYGTPERQMYLFERQLEIAQNFNLPVIIHNREADKEILDILKKKTPARGGIIHCFSSDYNFALSCIELGFFISFAGNLTYKKNIAIQEAAKKLPVSSILVETDSPYLSPQQVRDIPNNPSFVGYTYAYIAEQRGEDINNFIAKVKDNFIRLFGEVL